METQPPPRSHTPSFPGPPVPLPEIRVDSSGYQSASQQYQQQQQEEEQNYHHHHHYHDQQQQLGGPQLPPPPIAQAPQQQPYFPPPPGAEGVAVGGGGGGGGGEVEVAVPRLEVSQPPLAQQTITTPGGTIKPNPFAGSSIESIRTACEFSVGEYRTLQKRARPGDPTSDRRLRAQFDVVVSDLYVLRGEVATAIKAAEGHRWRRWILGGIAATFIPIIRKLFRRPSKDDKSSNDTEHAFWKSKRLLDSIRASVHGRLSALASMALFVFGVLWIFQNEVTLRVGRTVMKRIKKLTAKIERGGGPLSDKDMAILKGWRWRVLMW